MTYFTFTYDADSGVFEPYYRSASELEELPEFVIERANSDRYSVVKQKDGTWTIKQIRRVEDGSWKSPGRWIAVVVRAEGAPHIFHGFELAEGTGERSSKAFGTSTSLASTAEQIAGFAF